jgi:hypothetical protein
MNNEQKLLRNELLLFLNLHNKYYTLEEIKKTIIKKVKYNKKTNEITTTDEIKRFFMIDDNKINMDLLLSIISLKHCHRRDIPSNISYFEYYQQPIEFSFN